MSTGPNQTSFPEVRDLFSFTDRPGTRNEPQNEEAREQVGEDGKAKEAEEAAEVRTTRLPVREDEIAEGLDDRRRTGNAKRAFPDDHADDRVPDEAARRRDRGQQNDDHALVHVHSYFRAGSHRGSEHPTKPPGPGDD